MPISAILKLIPRNDSLSLSDHLILPKLRTYLLCAVGIFPELGIRTLQHYLLANVHKLWGIESQQVPTEANTQFCIGQVGCLTQCFSYLPYLFPLRDTFSCRVINASTIYFGTSRKNLPDFFLNLYPTSAEEFTFWLDKGLWVELVSPLSIGLSN